MGPVFYIKAVFSCQEQSSLETLFTAFLSCQIHLVIAGNSILDLPLAIKQAKTNSALKILI